MAYLSAETRRPLCDSVNVYAAEVLTYTIEADLALESGPSAAVVLAAAQAAAETYVAEHFRLGQEIALSGIYAALHQPGVRAVTLTSPAASIVPTQRQAARCTAITLAET
jgi:phage-related baseplate assembly protein